MLNKVERRRVQPLQIVEEQSERVFLARKYPNKAPENHLKAVLGVLRRQVRDRRLFPDHELQFGNEVDDQLTVRAQRLAQEVPPPPELRLALAKKRPDKAPEGLGQGGVRDIALVLIELARREQTALRDQRLVEFVHQRRFADAGIAGDEHELGPAVRHDPIEGAEQRLDLVLPAVKLLRRHETVRDIVSTERERLYAAMRLPFREALPQIDRETRGGLVAVLGILGEKLHHYRRDPLARRRRLAGNVAVHPFHRVGSVERQFARQHLVEGDPQGVEIAAGIN